MSVSAVMNSSLSLKNTLESLAHRYPAPLVKGQLEDIPRIAFHIELVANLTGRTAPTIVDVGGGIGLFTPGCAALGMATTLVDDFGDTVNLSDSGTSALALHRDLGVIIESRDVMAGLTFPADHFDAITCFESMEHWHHSPKKLFHDLIKSLKPGGIFILSAPNCVNLRKRITVPLGYGKWSPIDLWYGHAVFRGHVREADVQDLRYIGTDLGLKNVQILGRNWAGARRPIIRHILPLVDRLLELRPSLCSNIYLIGRKG